MTFEPNDGIWIFDINRDRIPQLCARYWDSFLSHCCSWIIYMYIRAVSSYSLWYLVSEVKVNLFHIWSCWSMNIFIHEGSISCATTAMCCRITTFRWSNDLGRCLKIYVSHHPNEKSHRGRDRVNSRTTPRHRVSHTNSRNRLQLCIATKATIWKVSLISNLVTRYTCCSPCTVALRNDIFTSMFHAIISTVKISFFSILFIIVLQFTENLYPVHRFLSHSLTLS